MMYAGDGENPEVGDGLDASQADGNLLNDVMGLITLCSV